MKKTLLLLALGCFVATGAIAKEDRNLSPDEYNLMREAGVAMECYYMHKAEKIDVQMPLFELYAQRPEIGKALMAGDRVTVISHMDNVQYQDFAGIKSQVTNNPGYYCSKYSK